MEDDLRFSNGEGTVEIPLTEESKYENLLLQAEQRYGSDISKLEQGLSRVRKLGLIHIIGLHYKLKPLFKITNKLLL